jgi:hypothetical protein
MRRVLGGVLFALMLSIAWAACSNSSPSTPTASSITTTSTVPTTSTTSTSTIASTTTTSISGTFTLSGVVRDDASSATIQGAEPEILSGPNAGKKNPSAANGAYSIPGLLAATFTVRFRASGYDNRDEVVTISNANVTRDVPMHRAATTTTSTVTTTSVRAPVPAPILPPKSGSTCSLDDIVHPASCVNNMFGNATAICDDGARSCSTSRPGTCSSHIGVYCWVCPGPLC